LVFLFLSSLFIYLP